MMTKFYYKTATFKPKGAFNVNLPLEEVEKELNRLGGLGWELVSSIVPANTAHMVVILKNSDENMS